MEEKLQETAFLLFRRFAFFATMADVSFFSLSTLLFSLTSTSLLLYRRLRGCYGRYLRMKLIKDEFSNGLLLLWGEEEGLTASQVHAINEALIVQALQGMFLCLFQGKGTPSVAF